MKNVTTTLTMLISGLVASIGKAEAYLGEHEKHATSEPTDPVSLRPLNLPGDNLFAAHRSHSSHRSHASHRSSSGGGYQSPAPAEPKEQSVTPNPATPRTPALSRAEKQKLQVMRVQIALTSLGLYKGPIGGELDEATKESLKHFQTLKGLQSNGLMTTETLNALSVPAVQ
jgi:His-Xaa-Ser repeat protein HxsA